MSDKHTATPALIDDKDAVSRARLQRIAYEWIRTYDKAPVPNVWKERIAALCAEFAELIYGDYRRQLVTYQKIAEDALTLTPPKPIVRAALAEKPLPDKDERK